jgi:hypothetical protein
VSEQRLIQLRQLFHAGVTVAVAEAVIMAFLFCDDLVLRCVGCIAFTGSGIWLFVDFCHCLWAWVIAGLPPSHPDE